MRPLCGWDGPGVTALLAPRLGRRPGRTQGSGLAFGEGSWGLPRLTRAPPPCRQGPGLLTQVTGLTVQPDHLPADLPLAV